MYKNVTLNEFIMELQKLAATRGNDELLSIGAASGQIFGLTSPYCFNFKGYETEYVPAFSRDIRPLAPVQEAPVREGAGELRQVWVRVGMTLDITPEEEKAIFEGDYTAGKKAVMRVIEAGRASVDGETYIPEECIESFDEENGTNYRDREDECAWTMDGEYVNASRVIPGLDSLGLPSVEQVEELVGQMRKYSEEEYDLHNNYIAEDLAEAADVLSKLVAARVFTSEDLARESVDGLIEEAAERSGSSGVVIGKEQNYQKG